MKKHLLWTVPVLAVIVSLQAASAKPTPIPGGANQASGVQGTIGSRLFNGEVRLKPLKLRDATAADGLAPSPGQRWLVFTADASNGMHRALDMQQFIASIVDSGGNILQAQPDKIRPIGGLYGVPPGGHWNEQVFFQVPTQFTPAKILLAPYNGKHAVFRIKIRPQDYRKTQQ